jgi:hypothetical protein
MKSISDRIPLRDSTAWAAYRKAEWIPHRYGVCGGALLQYDGTRTRFVWADHPTLAVDTVLADGVVTTGWTARNDVDSTGRAVTFVEFASPVDEGVELIARGRGKRNAVSGVLLENPADVLYDILVNVAGLPYPAARFDEFRAETIDLVVGGSIEDDAPAFTVARSLCESIGAICAPDMRGFARLYPGAAAPATTAVDYRASATATCSRAAIVNDLTIRYAIEAGTPRGAVQYEAPTSIARFGRRERVVDAPWLTSPRAAATVAARQIELLARRRWAIPASNIQDTIRVGQTVDVDHPVVQAVGAAVALSREFDPATETSAIALELPIGAVPALRLIRNSTASSALEPSQSSAQIVNGQVEIVIADTDGTPLSGADCTLDPDGNNITRRSDAAGRVVFPAWAATPGQHTVLVRYGDRTLPPIILTVT